MGFAKKFHAIVFVLLVLPFIVILLLAKSGAESCLNNIESNLPDVIIGDMKSIDEGISKYCDPNTGKFLFVKKVSDITLSFYEYYIWIALILSAIIAGILEASSH